MYEPDEWYDATVKPATEPPKIQIVELDLEQDTIFVYGSRTIRFAFDAGRSDVLMVKLMIDGIVVDSVEQSSGTLDYDSWVEKPTIRELELQLTVTSGSGSIADKLHAEGYQLSQKWIMVHDKYLAGNVKHTIDNGQLLLSWDSYRAKDFKAYEIVRGNYYYTTIGETSDLHFYIDKYVGEGATFTVNVLLQNGQSRSWGNVAVPKEIPTPRLVSTGESSYIVTWSPTSYYKSFKAYHLTVDYAAKQSFNSLNDTTVSINAVFGDKIQLELLVEPVEGNKEYNASNPDQFENSVYLGVGHEVNIAHPAAYLKLINADEFAFRDENFIQIFRPEAGKIVRNLRIRPDDKNSYGIFSAGAKYFIGYTNNEAPFNPQYFSTNLETGEIVAQNEYKNLIGINSNFTTISDNGSGIVTGSNYEAGFNFQTATMTYKLSGNRFSSGLQISRDSKYILLFSDSIILKRFENTKSTRLTAMSNSNLSVRKTEFNPQNSNELMMATDTKMFLYQCEPFMLKTEFNLQTDEVLLFIDFYRREVLTGLAKKLRIRSLDDWSIRKEIAISTTTNSSSNIVLCNRYVILYNTLMKRFVD